MEFADWVCACYCGQLSLSRLEGGEGYRSFLSSQKSALASHKARLLSGVYRVLAFHITKFGNPLSREGYVAAVFSARLLDGDQPRGRGWTHFSYAYWRRRQAAAGGAAVSPRPGGDPPRPEYICLSPTYQSQDGEYRHHFYWYENFERIYGASGGVPALALLESCFLAAIAAKRLEIDVSFFPASEAGGPEAYVQASRFCIKALVASFARDRYSLFSPHQYPGYRALMGGLCRLSGELFAEWGAQARPAFHRYKSFGGGGRLGWLRHECGQKLIPLTLREVAGPYDINFASWREVWVNRQATDLVVNRIAPTFAIYGSWTLLDGAGETLFENKEMRRRYALSARAAAVVGALRRARAEGGEDPPPPQMESLDARIRGAVAYAQSFLLLADAALCSVSESVGMTFPTLHAAMRRREHHRPSLAFSRFFEVPAMQARYFFDLCYGVRALHARIGAVHGDLHLNNMTFYGLHSQYSRLRYHQDKEGRPRLEVHEARPGALKQAVIAYTLEGRGEADTYVFPHDGCHSCVIDFSRVILGPAARPKLVADHGEAYAAGFYRSQVSRALRVLHHYIPAFVEKHQEVLKGLALANFSAFFRALTAVDYLAIGRNLGGFLRSSAELQGSPDYISFRVAPEGPRLAAAIERAAMDGLVANLTRLVEGGASAADVGVADVGAAIFGEAFAPFRYSSWAAAGGGGRGAPALAAGMPPAAKAVLVDLYDGGAPLKYSGTDYARFPPWARFDEIERHLGGMPIEKVTGGRGAGPFLESLGPSAYLSCLEERARQKEADDLPAAATSSWII
jgi:hypothetical protein